jgi:Mg2+ and Co2+ transporter CorA
MYLTKTERNASAYISRRFYRRLQKYQGQLHRAIQAKDKQAIQSARDDIREMYEDIAEHNKKMISDGKINMTVNLRADTIADNFYNEIAGGNRTLSNLPSDDRYMARERLKKLPRGID